MRHFNVYDMCGDMFCVDAHHYKVVNGILIFFPDELEYEHTDMFNWSNVVCVREEEDDDEEEATPVPPVFSGALN